MNTAIAIGMSGLMLLFGRPLLGIFTRSEDVIVNGLVMMFCVTPFYLTFVPIEMLSGTMRGMGNSLGPMLTSCIGVCVLRIAWIFTVVPLNKTIQTVLISYPISWCITAIAMFFYFRRFGKKAKLLGKNCLT